MGVTKAELFTEEQNNLAGMAKILAHPARVAILQYLLRENTCINSVLVEELGLAQATISQHLKELKQAGFIKGSIEGVSVCYCIDEGKWAELKAEFETFFNSLKPAVENNSCC
jgi:DNA-binding transcriptional ArsR family regulator